MPWRSRKSFLIFFPTPALLVQLYEQGRQHPLQDLQHISYLFFTKAYFCILEENNKVDRKEQVQLISAIRLHFWTRLTKIL